MIPGTSAQLDANLAYVQGDTWGGIPTITVTPAPSYTADSAIFAIKRQASDIQVVKQLSSGDGEIVISDDTNWIFTIPAQTLALNAGTYVWQFRVTDSNGGIQTYLQGSMQVLPQYSLPA
jgi:hypothetical protein